MTYLVSIKRSVILVLVALFATHSPFSLGQTQRQGFKEWLLLVEQEAITKGISRQATNRAIKHIRFLPQVIRLDRDQPEFVNTFLNYYDSHVTPQRVVDGRRLLRRYRTLFSRLEKQYGVPKETLVAFWGLETNYGKNQGGIDTLSALATLAYEGRRAEFFKRQLFDALHIVDEQQLTLRDLNGSWAGAFGHMQFMPSTFKQFAIDGDGNDMIDLKRSIPDALYSAAHYLSSVGWDISAPSMVEVKLPKHFAYELASLNEIKPISEWMAMGVAAVQAVVSDAQFAKMKAGPAEHIQAITKQGERALMPGLNRRIVKTLPISQLTDNPTLESAILLPQGWRGPAFMVFNNFHTILDWNRSVNYALSVALLAQQLDQKITLVHGADAVKGALKRVEILRLQTMLNDLGFDSGRPDGYPGLQTQSAIRAYQLTQALPADGYANPRLFRHVELNHTLSF